MEEVFVIKRVRMGSASVLGMLISGYYHPGYAEHEKRWPENIFCAKQYESYEEAEFDLIKKIEPKKNTIYSIDKHFVYEK